MEYPIIDKKVDRSIEGTKEDVIKAVLNNPFAAILSMGGLSLRICPGILE